MSSEYTWTSEVEEICEKLRINSVNLSEYHRKRYYHFKGYSKYFRIPLIVLASINATASVGLKGYMDQDVISGITCLLGMSMGILGSIELYLGIQSSMELEMKQSKEFYTLSVDLFKTLSLRRENRSEDGKDFLNKKYSYYIKLCEASNLLKRKLSMDLLNEIPSQYLDHTPKSSDADSSPRLQLPLYKTPRPSIHSTVDEIPLTGDELRNEVLRDLEQFHASPVDNL
mgnify:CR=1 FL=1|tara:strand:+ start:7882 stop:8565 length:684 start_codon:yes stop_codon:yes gene_type:complete